jgi:hypothetical protein
VEVRVDQAGREQVVAVAFDDPRAGRTGRTGAVADHGDPRADDEDVGGSARRPGRVGVVHEHVGEKHGGRGHASPPGRTPWTRSGAA